MFCGTYPLNQDQIAFIDSKLHFNNTFVGNTNPTYNGGFTSRIYMTGDNRRNTISKRGNNNNNTKYNIFHNYIYLPLPLNKEVIL